MTSSDLMLTCQQAESKQVEQGAGHGGGGGGAALI